MAAPVSPPTAAAPNITIDPPLSKNPIAYNQPPFRFQTQHIANG